MTTKVSSYQRIQLNVLMLDQQKKAINELNQGITEGKEYFILRGIEKAVRKLGLNFDGKDLF